MKHEREAARLARMGKMYLRVVPMRLRYVYLAAEYIAAVEQGRSFQERAEPSQAVIDAALCRDDEDEGAPFACECQACGRSIVGAGAVLCIPCRDQYDDASDNVDFAGAQP